ncbi:MAG: prepilin-type N-terminal cleavage/methylation domain-containing protein [Synergistales bacterium]|jgi:prepilin-type N-terminal cleavage/methylation domain-containing protein|nr:prepilin-type N-terminal cleavage/methylation domain-containing protein [Synergistales bacterium]
MSIRTRGAFTLAETLVAVAILGLVAAGSMRLAALSSRALGEVREGRERLTLLRGMWLRAVSGELEDRGREDAVSWESGRFDFPGQDGLPQGYSCRKIVLLPGEKAARGSGDGREQIVLYVPDGMFAGGKQQ